MQCLHLLHVLVFILSTPCSFAVAPYTSPMCNNNILLSPSCTAVHSDSTQCQLKNIYTLHNFSYALLCNHTWFSLLLWFLMGNTYKKNRTHIVRSNHAHKTSFCLQACNQWRLQHTLSKNSTPYTFVTTYIYKTYKKKHKYVCAHTHIKGPPTKHYDQPLILPFSAVNKKTSTPRKINSLQARMQLQILTVEDEQADRTAVINIGTQFAAQL